MSERSRWGVFGNLAFTVILIASSLVECRHRDVRHLDQLADDQPQSRPDDGVGGPGRDDVADVSADPAGRRAGGHRRRAAPPSRRPARRHRHRRRLRRDRLVASCDARDPSRDDLRSRGGRRARRARLAARSRRCWRPRTISTAPSPSTTPATTSAGRSARRLAGSPSQPSASTFPSGAIASAISRWRPRCCGGALRAGSRRLCPPSASPAPCGPDFATSGTTATWTRRSSAPSPSSCSRAPIGRFFRWSRGRRCTTGRRSTACCSA